MYCFDYTRWRFLIQNDDKNKQIMYAKHQSEQYIFVNKKDQH